MNICDDETVDIQYEHPDFNNETLKQVIHTHSDKVSRTTFEIHRKNLIWNEGKYQEAMTANSIKRKRNAIGDKSDKIKKANMIVLERIDEEKICRNCG